MSDPDLYGLRYRIEELELILEELIEHLGLTNKIRVPADYGKKAQRAAPKARRAAEPQEKQF